MSRLIDCRASVHMPVNTTIAAPRGLAPVPATFFVQRAIDFARQQPAARGFAAAPAPEFIADPHVLVASSGASAVHLRQTLKGIPIFEATQAVRFDHTGQLSDSAGATVAVAEDVAINVSIRPEEAAQAAARYVAVPDADELGDEDDFGQGMRYAAWFLADYSPKVLCAFRELPMQPTVLEAGPFTSPVRTSLIWFPQDKLRLGWDVVLFMPDGEGQYRVIVDAANLQILYVAQLIKSIAARGHVYLRDPSSERQFVDFPVPLASFGLDLPADLPAGFPGSWTDATTTEGNAVQATSGDSDAPTTATGASPAIFDPAEPLGTEQQVLNMFYFNSYLHDFFYVLGFREADGNFQLNSFSAGGVPGDRVQARAFAEPVFATANMTTPADGTPPVMSMGIVATTNRHTALDATVVMHEFCHGVTSRLVGGPLNSHSLDAPQSSAMGEGWSDYFACTINGCTTVGAWVLDNPAGIRGFPYDDDFPDDFGKIGTGRYDEIHNVGEIWAATLMRLNRRIGVPLALQLVVDALKLSPASPNFLDMRDAILAAFDAKAAAGQLAGRAVTRNDLWAVFAKAGMGPQAAAQQGTALAGTVADFVAPGTVASPHPAPAPAPAPAPVAPPGPAPAVGTIHLQASSSAAIPAADPLGVDSTLNVEATGAIAHVAVSVELDHPSPDELQLLLAAPDGSMFLLSGWGLAASAGRGQYDESSPASLSTLVGRSPRGAWTLNVADRGPGRVGNLRSWGLDIVLA